MASVEGTETSEAASGVADVRRIAIIQARMSSSRYPGKTMKLLAGRPVIWHVFYRLKQCRSIDEVVLATSTDPTDDPLARYAEEQGVRVVRGPLDNVLQRYVMAAEVAEADVIVRVTGDCPLIDPPMIDRMIDTLVAEDADYAARDREHRTIHAGFEPFSARALAQVVEVAGDDPANIEHVTPMMKRRPDLFDITYVPSEPDERIEGVRTSVDTPADLAFLEELYSRLGSPPGEIDVREVVTLLREHPELTEINAHVRQKKAFEETRTVLFRCDSTGEAGTERVERCVALARELADRHSWGVRFAVQGDPAAAAAIGQHGFGVEALHAGDAAEADARFLELVERQKPTAVVLCTQRAPLPELIAGLASSGIRAVHLDDLSETGAELLG